MPDDTYKNTSVFVEGDFSRKERIDRKGWKRK